MRGGGWLSEGVLVLVVKVVGGVGNGGNERIVVVAVLGKEN